MSLDERVALGNGRAASATDSASETLEAPIRSLNPDERDEGRRSINRPSSGPCNRCDRTILCNVHWRIANAGCQSRGLPRTCHHGQAHGRSRARPTRIGLKVVDGIFGIVSNVLCRGVVECGIVIEDTRAKSCIENLVNNQLGDVSSWIQRYTLKTLLADAIDAISTLLLKRRAFRIGRERRPRHKAPSRPALPEGGRPGGAPGGPAVGDSGPIYNPDRRAQKPPTCQ